MDKNKQQLVYVGSFRIGAGDTLNITDPCYDNEVWCRANVKAEEIETGVFNAYALEYDCGNWGKRIGQLIIVNEKYISLDFEDSIEIINFNEYIDNVGVDAGLCGFFVNKPNYKEDYKNNPIIDEWDKICNFLYAKGYNSNYWMATKDNPFKCNGVCSSSGFGDGGYDVYSASDNNLKYAFKIVFIEEDEV